jgi:hypothetical protein
MKIKHLLYPALSLSVTLAACTPQHALQAPPSALSAADAVQADQVTQQVSFAYHAPQSFSTQVVDPNAVKFIKLTLVGEGINGSLSTSDFVAVVGGKATATINKVPIQPGNVRVVTVQGYDENQEPLPAFVGKGYYKSQAGQSTVSLPIDRRRLATGLVLEQLLQSNADVASGLNLDDLQAQIDAATGFKNNTFVIDPLQLNIQALATQLLANQTPTVNDIKNNASLGNVRLYVTPRGEGIFTEALTIEVDDPESTAQDIAVNASPQLVSLQVAPGVWTARAKKADGTVIGTTPITVTAKGGVDKPIIILNLKPVIDSLSPGHDIAVGGTSVTLTGTGFTGATEVKFGNAVATALNVVSDTELTVNAPAGTVGKTTVTVTTPGGVSQAASFSYVANEVSAMTPASASIGDKVTLTGVGFDTVAANNSVKFGNVIAEIDTQAQNSSTRLTVTVPADISGRPELTVTSGAHVGLGKTFSVLPAVTGLSATSGSPTGGGTMTVTGSGFVTKATSVKFGSTAATDVTVNSNTSLTATIPEGTVGEINVTVTTAGGTSTTPAASKYAYTGLVSVFDGNHNAADVIFANNQYVAVGDKVWTSPDGVNWTVQNSGVSFISAVTFGNNQYLGVNQGGEIMTSTDGANWISSMTVAKATFYSVAYGNNQYVAVGNSAYEGLLLTSPDGANWTPILKGNLYLHIIFANNQYVAVGASGVITTSPDGVTWTDRASGTASNLRGVVYGNNQYVAVGNSGVITTSSDGVTWTVRASGTTSSLNSVAYGNNQYVALDALGAIISSPDGVTWSKLDSGVNASLLKIAFNAGKFVVISNFGPFYNLVGL